MAYTVDASWRWHSLLMFPESLIFRQWKNWAKTKRGGVRHQPGLPLLAWTPQSYVLYTSSPAVIWNHTERQICRIFNLFKALFVAAFTALCTLQWQCFCPFKKNKVSFLCGRWLLIKEGNTHTHRFKSLWLLLCLRSVCGFSSFTEHSSVIR